MRIRRATLLAVILASASCGDEDYVRVTVQSNEAGFALASDVRVVVSGGGRSASKEYRPRPEALTTDFVVAFDEAAGTEVDIRVTTRPSGAAVDWGGDLRVTRPGGARTLPLVLAPGESTVSEVAVLDGDMQTAAGYGEGVALGWPTSAGTVAILPITPGRPPGDRFPQFGERVARVRLASRPSNASSLFAAAWLDKGAVPTLRVQRRDAEPGPPVAIGNERRASDIQVALSRTTSLEPAIATAILVDGRVKVFAHDEAGAVTSGPLEPVDLDRVNRIVGIVVTPDGTVTLAVNGGGGRLVQLDAASGAVRHVTPLVGQAVALALSADGTRLLVASVDGVGAAGRLLLDVFSVKTPTRTTDAPADLGPYEFVPGVPTSRVSLASCAVAWPERRRDGSAGSDIRFRELDGNGAPLPGARLANVATVGRSFAPSVVCLSESRAFVSFVTSDVDETTGKLAIRALPSSR